MLRHDTLAFAAFAAADAGCLPPRWLVIYADYAQLFDFRAYDASIFHAAVFRCCRFSRCYYLFSYILLLLLFAMIFDIILMLVFRHFR